MKLQETLDGFKLTPSKSACVWQHAECIEKRRTHKLSPASYKVCVCMSITLKTAQNVMHVFQIRLKALGGLVSALVDGRQKLCRFKTMIVLHVYVSVSQTATQTRKHGCINIET